MAPAAVIGNTDTRGGRAPARVCGATAKSTRKPCGRGRGWGTDHPGYGNCKHHGGCTPSGKHAAAREAAALAVRADFGGEVDIDPIEALLYTVRRGAHLAGHWQRTALAAESPEEFAAAADRESRALGELNRWAKNAVDGGVAERQVRIAERFGDALIAAAEEALAALEAVLGHALTVEQRTAYANAYGAGLGRLEAGDVEARASDVDTGR